MPSWKAMASERLGEGESRVSETPSLAGKKTFIQSIINAALGFDMTGRVRARAESQFISIIETGFLLVARLP